MNWNPNEYYKSHSVATTYDAKRFSSFAGKVFNVWEQRVIERCFMRLPKGSQIVDIPCGTGRLAERLLSAGYRVHGVDISSEMLDVAQTRLRRFGTAFTCEMGDARDLNDNLRTYEAVLCARVLMHFPLSEQITFLRGAARLGPDTVVINHSLNSPYQRFRRRVKRWLGHQPSADHPVSNRDIQTLLHNAGLREVRRFRLLPLISEAIYIVATGA